MATKIVLKNVRLSFAHGLFQARANDDGGDPKFSCKITFEKEGAIQKQIEAAMLEAAGNKWPGKGQAMYDALKAQGRIAICDGNLKPEWAGFEGLNYVTASNATRPPVRDRDGKTPLVQSDGRPYSGSIVNLIVEAWGQDNKAGGKRINLSLMGCQFVKDGPAFGGGGVAADTDFEELTEGSDADDLI